MSTFIPEYSSLEDFARDCNYTYEDRVNMLVEIENRQIPKKIKRNLRTDIIGASGSMTYLCLVGGPNTFDFSSDVTLLGPQIGGVLFAYFSFCLLKKGIGTYRHFKCKTQAKKGLEYLASPQ